MSEDADRQELLGQLERLKAMGEKDYDDMYEAHSPGGATACYSGVKENLYDAIGLANRLGLMEEAEALTKRLAHIKAVFRSQFS
jgi:hypothetical protein